MISSITLSRFISSHFRNSFRECWHQLLNLKMSPQGVRRPTIWVAPYAARRKTSLTFHNLRGAPHSGTDQTDVTEHFAGFKELSTLVNLLKIELFDVFKFLFLAPLFYDFFS